MKKINKVKVKSRKHIRPSNIINHKFFNIRKTKLNNFRMINSTKLDKYEN